MIGSLRGVVTDTFTGSLLLEVQGVGYCVHASNPTLSKLTAGVETRLYIHDHIREDSHDLYGFLSQEEQQFFEQLISISGVGPKVALALLSGGFDAVRRAVMAGDLTMLTSIQGVGTKTAQKIVLELKGQLVDEEDAIEGGDQEVVDALVGLGYSASQARGAVKHLDPSVTDSSERVRQALKLLSKTRS